MDITLVILAAGIGSRYGGGVKQLESVGPQGEIIMDYSVHDAIAAGFNKIVFIINRRIEQDFYEVIGHRMEEKFKALGVKWAYAFQEMTDMPERRTKPWGTGQAVLSCKGILQEPFAVINADDYYGREAFCKAYDFLAGYVPGEKEQYAMVGYILKNTLSDNGGVTRGICTTDENGRLIGIDETRGIVKTPQGAAAPKGDEMRSLDLESLVSMNFWMFPASFVERLEEGFPLFRENMSDPLKDEYLLPVIVDGLLRSGRAEVTVIPTEDSWFGVTYKEDKKTVVDAFRELYARGAYEPVLYSDLT